jgi:hypothetical protein
MFDALLSLVSGPLLGGIFGCVNAYLANKEKAAEREHEVAMAREDRETRRVEAEMQMRVTEEEFSGKAFLASQTAGNKTALSSSNLKVMLSGGWLMRVMGGFLAFLLGLTDVARGAVRPGVTIYLSIVCTSLLDSAMRFTGGVPIALQQEIATEGVIRMFNLLSMIVAWWFGDRMTTRIMRSGR